ncbi:hypothetical protein [Shimia sp. Alg240-R146]|uniref:hypothetical protein n=1 Tax=Shimia sp. Alg240-R146 TaxID=2993449 RepID=UPI0022E60307|nr:hypothetical protein [Shimia sp. Alg240-R146]
MSAARFFLILPALAFFCSMASAQDARPFNGHWQGVWKDNSRTAVSVFIHIQSGQVREYVWDGRPVDVSTSEMRNGDPHPNGDTTKNVNPDPLFVGCFGTSLPNQQKLELTYPVLCKSSSYRVR